MRRGRSERTRTGLEAVGGAGRAVVLVFRWCWSGGVHPGARLATLQRAPLVLGEPTPDTGVLTGAEGPVQARLHHGAATADSLRLLDLHHCRAGRPDREEQLGVFVPAERAVAPVHGGVLLGVVIAVQYFSRRPRPRCRADTGCPALWLSDYLLVTGKLRSLRCFHVENACQANGGRRSTPREQPHHARARPATRRNHTPIGDVDKRDPTCVRERNAVLRRRRAAPPGRDERAGRWPCRGGLRRAASPVAGRR